MTYQTGDVVRFDRGYGPETAVVVSESEHGEFIMVEHHQLVRPKARVAFGQKVDRSPYRFGGVFSIRPGEYPVIKLSGAYAARFAKEQADIKAYPTYNQRRYRRDKARKVREGR